MKLPLAMAALFGAVQLWAGVTPAPAETTPIVTANSRLGRGINLGNALDAPAEGAWGVVLQSEYFQTIRQAGFDSVRLPVRWSAHAGKEPPYTIDPVFAARVDWAINQALTSKLNIVVNVHHYEEMDADPDAHLERLTAIWRQVAERYQTLPNSVYFELYNEPHNHFTAEKWNPTITTILQTVRASNPVRPIIVGPTSWNAIHALDELQLPESDQNLIVTVHYYDPFRFTHQGASWIKDANQWPSLAWTGSEAEKTAVRTDLEKAARWGREHGRPLFLGEFGAFSKADIQSRANWTRQVAQEANRLGISWAYWEFSSGFGAYDPAAERWREPLKSALLVN